LWSSGILCSMTKEDEPRLVEAQTPRHESAEPCIRLTCTEPKLTLDEVWDSDTINRIAALNGITVRSWSSPSPIPPPMSLSSWRFSTTGDSCPHKTATDALLRAHLQQPSTSGSGPAFDVVSCAKELDVVGDRAERVGYSHEHDGRYGVSDGSHRHQVGEQC
jgi:hypothetical protein